MAHDGPLHLRLDRREGYFTPDARELLSCLVVFRASALTPSIDHNAVEADFFVPACRNQMILQSCASTINVRTGFELLAR